MKKFIIINCATAFAFAATASEMISGAYNTTLGYLAGLDGSGDRITAVGAAAGGSSWENGNTTFVGAASGVGSYYLQNCIGLGYRSLRQAHNMTNVVAIGSGAFSEAEGHRDATWINGHFYAENGKGVHLFETNDRNAPGAASLSISNGVAVIKGDLVVTGDIWRRADGLLSDNENRKEFDYYLSASYGDDDASGNESAPCRTIAGVLNRIQSDCDNGLAEGEFFTVGVHRGTYEYPGDIPSVGVELVAIDGKEKTFIAPLSDDSPRRISKSASGVNYLTGFRGFTFEGFNTDISFRWSGGNPDWVKRSAFFLIEFTDCVFQNAHYINTRPNNSMSWYAFTFNCCVCTDCEVKPTVVPIFELQKNNGNNPGISDIIYRSEFRNCVIRFGADEDLSVDYAKSVCAYTRMENCFVEIPKAGSYYALRAASTHTTVTGLVSGFYDSTIIIRESKNYTPSLDSQTNGRLYDCLVSFPVGGWSDRLTENGNRSEIGFEFGEDYRPNDYALRFYGYHAQCDRGLRNSIIGDLVNALEAHDQPAVAARMRMMMIPPSEETAPPKHDDEYHWFYGERIEHGKTEEESDYWP